MESPTPDSVAFEISMSQEEPIARAQVHLALTSPIGGALLNRLSLADAGA